MKKLWSLVNGMDIKQHMKNKLYLGVLIFANSLIGAILWLLSGRFFLTGPGWLLCFAGYPAIFIGFFGGMIYLYNHKFA